MKNINGNRAEAVAFVVWCLMMIPTVLCLYVCANHVQDGIGGIAGIFAIIVGTLAKCSASLVSDSIELGLKKATTVRIEAFLTHFRPATLEEFRNDPLCMAVSYMSYVPLKIRGWV